MSYARCQLADLGFGFTADRRRGLLLLLEVFLKRRGAAVVWANTREGATAHAVAYNVMFIASVSSLLFNGNPLLRYDAYYILSDLLEIPNLWQRSREYLYYLIRRYVWGVRQARAPANTPGERVWMLVYAVASSIYRVFIGIVILLTILNSIGAEAVTKAQTAIVTIVLVVLSSFAIAMLLNMDISMLAPSTTLP
jgi:putative peptide zinc metalloprotease protein